MAGNLNTMARQFSRNATKFSRLLVRLRKGGADTSDFGDYPGSQMMVIQVPPGQTASAIEVQDSTGVVPATGTVLFKIGADGTPTFPAGSVSEAALKTSASFGLGSMRTARAKYDFAVDGGAISTITLATNAAIPNNAIIVGGIINPTTAPVGATATIAFGTSAGSSASALKAATAVATYTLNSLLATVPVFTAASAVKMTAAGSVTMSIATAALTAGVIEITLVYFVAGA